VVEIAWYVARWGVKLLSKRLTKSMVYRSVDEPQVWSGTWHSRKVAVKQMLLNDMSDDNIADFCREIKILRCASRALTLARSVVSITHGCLFVFTRQLAETSMHCRVPRCRSNG